MQVSVIFDPTKDAQTAVAALIATIYGTAVVTAAATTPAPAAQPGMPVIPGTTPAAEADDGVAADPMTPDNTGVRWDARIHSDPPKMTGKGVWRKKRGVDDTTFNSVSAELRAGAPVIPSAPQLPVAAPAPAAIPQMPTLAAIPQMPAPAPAMTPYQRLCDYIARHSKTDTNPAGKIEPAWLQMVLRDSMGVASGDLRDMAAWPEASLDAALTAFATAVGVPA